MSIDQYSTTPASNDLVNYFKTGMRPSAVKNAGWDVMADLAQLFNSKTTSSGTNAITLANPRPFASLTPGLWCVFWPLNANTAACTFAPDGLTPKNVVGNAATLKGGEFNPAVPALLVYDGAQWNFINPNRSTASFTLTLSDSIGAVTVTVATEPSGKIFTATAPAVQHTSSVITLTGTGVPAAYQVATAKGVACGGLIDNSLGTCGTVNMTPSSSTWTFCKLGNANGWTSALLKGFAASGFAMTWAAD